MDNHSRFERRRVRADGKHGAVRATMSYARIFSVVALLVISFLSEATLAQTPSYWVQVSGARVEACTVSGCIADPSGGAPLSTGQPQQSRFLRLSRQLRPAPSTPLQHRLRRRPNFQLISRWAQSERWLERLPQMVEAQLEPLEQPLGATRSQSPREDSSK
jgi:hypothetical protein